MKGADGSRLSMRGVHACLLAQSQLWPCGLNFREVERLCVKLAMLKMGTPPPPHSVLSLPVVWQLLIFILWDGY